MEKSPKKALFLGIFLLIAGMFLLLKEVHRNSESMNDYQCNHESIRDFVQRRWRLDQLEHSSLVKKSSTSLFKSSKASAITLTKEIEPREKIDWGKQIKGILGNLKHVKVIFFVLRNLLIKRQYDDRFGDYDDDFILAERPKCREIPNLSINRSRNAGLLNSLKFNLKIMVSRKPMSAREMDRLETGKLPKISCKSITKPLSPKQSMKSGKYLVIQLPTEFHEKYFKYLDTLPRSDHVPRIDVMVDGMNEFAYSEIHSADIAVTGIEHLPRESPPSHANELYLNVRVLTEIPGMKALAQVYLMPRQELAFDACKIIRENPFIGTYKCRVHVKDVI